MVRSFISVFILAAVFQRAICDSADCFLGNNTANAEKLYNAAIKPFKGFTVDLCRPVKEYIDATLNVTKGCKTKKIDLLEAEAFTRDFCTVGWDTNNRFSAQESCFRKQVDNAKVCGQNITNITQILDGGTAEVLKEIYRGVCKDLTGAYNCLNEKLSKDCGDEGLALIKKVTYALDSFTKGVCLEVGGASTLSTLSWSVLLGILSIVLTWHKY